jgi:hypothetical protein
MVVAPRTGDVVKISSIWFDNFAGAHRVVDAIKTDPDAENPTQSPGGDDETSEPEPTQPISPRPTPSATPSTSPKPTPTDDPDTPSQTTSPSPPDESETPTEDVQQTPAPTTDGADSGATTPDPE